MADEEEKSDEVEELMKLLGVDPGKVADPSPDPDAKESDPVSDPQVQTGGETPAEEVSLGDLGPEAAEVPPIFESFSPSAGMGEASIEMLRDVNLQIKVVLGRTKLFVSEVLKFSPGSVVELDKLTGDPLDLFVNDRLVARGEVLIINENFAVRITEVINPNRANEE